MRANAVKQRCSLFQRLPLPVIFIYLAILAGCSRPLPPLMLPDSRDISPLESETIWKARGIIPPTDELSHFMLLDSGSVSLKWRLALIDSATLSINAQYFLWKFDQVGSLLMDRLLKAADRGVLVRLLVDDSFLSGEDVVLEELDEHPNIEVRIFNPFSRRSNNIELRFLENLNDFSRTNHRMHNKVLTADNQVAIVGGRNIGDEYFGFNQDHNFRDFDILTNGTVVPEITKGFDIYWNSEWSYPIPRIDQGKVDFSDLEKLRKELTDNFTPLHSWLALLPGEGEQWAGHWQEYTEQAIPGRALVLLDDPNFHEGQTGQHVAMHLRRATAQSKKSITMISAYLIPTDSLTKVIAERQQAGVQFHFLTNSLASNNHIPAHVAYQHHRKSLLKLGANLYEFKRDAAERSRYQAKYVDSKQFGLHAKVSIFDRQRVLIGSLNLDPRSMILNTEIGLLIDSVPLAEAITAAFTPDFSPQNSWRLDLDENDNVTWHSGSIVLNKQPAGTIWRALGDIFFDLIDLDNEM